jgi:hypothetical protein
MRAKILPMQTSNEVLLAIAAVMCFLSPSWIQELSPWIASFFRRRRPAPSHDLCRDGHR